MVNRAHPDSNEFGLNKIVGKGDPKWTMDEDAFGRLMSGEFNCDSFCSLGAAA